MIQIRAQQTFRLRKERPTNEIIEQVLEQIAGQKRDQFDMAF